MTRTWKSGAQQAQAEVYHLTDEATKHIDVRVKLTRWEIRGVRISLNNVPEADKRRAVEAMANEYMAELFKETQDVPDSSK